VNTVPDGDDVVHVPESSHAASVGPDRYATTPDGVDHLRFRESAPGRRPRLRANDWLPLRHPFRPCRATPHPLPVYP
jgi:hypothetical protein